MGKAKDFFNLRSFETSERCVHLKASDFARRAQAAFETVSKLDAPSDMKFSSVGFLETLPITRSLARGEGTVYHRSIGKDTIVEVADIPPHYAGSSGGDAFYAVERLVMISDKKKGAGEKGDIFIRLSPQYDPSVNVVLCDKFSNASFIHDGSDVSEAVRKQITKALKQVDSKVPVPKWIKDFSRHYTLKDRLILAKKPQGGP